jgi:sugar O-acyltransferase (sialic acid O-acetyltransferase NeuD family)
MAGRKSSEHSQQLQTFYIMKKPLLLIGGGGHCRSCIDVIEAEGKYTIEGICDTPDKIGTSILGYPIIAKDDELEAYINKGFYFLITIGQIKSSHIRKKIYYYLEERNALLATVVSPNAKVSRHASVGAGTIVMHGAFVNAGAVVGDNVILNTNCLVEHDTIVGSHVHVSTHAVLNGGVVVAEDTFIGSNTVVVQEVQIGKEVVVGAGSVVTSHILTAGLYAGSPAKSLQK